MDVQQQNSTFHGHKHSDFGRLTSMMQNHKAVVTQDTDTRIAQCLFVSFQSGNGTTSIHVVHHSLCS